MFHSPAVDYAGDYFVLGFEVEELDALDAVAPAARMNLLSRRTILPNWLMTMNSPVSSRRLLPVTFPTLGWSSRPNSQNGNPSKINPEKVACFSSPNPDHQLTIFHHQSTTTSPSKNHVLPRVFAKTPAKTGSPRP